MQTLWRRRLINPSDQSQNRGVRSTRGSLLSHDAKQPQHCKGVASVALHTRRRVNIPIPVVRRKLRRSKGVCAGNRTAGDKAQMKRTTLRPNAASGARTQAHLEANRWLRFTPTATTSPQDSTPATRLAPGVQGRLRCCWSNRRACH